MTTTVNKLHSAQAALARARQNNQTIKNGLVGTLAATAGGAVGAAVAKYLPQVVPGEGAGDTASVMFVDIVVTGLALTSGDTNWMAFAYGMHGYFAGNTAELILP